MSDFEQIADKYATEQDRLLIRMTRSMFIAELETAARNAVMLRDASAQCNSSNGLLPRQQASQILFGDIHWIDREDMADMMDDEFALDDGANKRNISPNALIAELEAASKDIEPLIAKLDACLVPDNILDEVRATLMATRTPAAIEAVRAAYTKEAAERDVEIAQLRAQVKQQRACIDWISTWVSQPIGNFSVAALDGLFRMARDRIASLSSTVGRPNE